MQNPHPLLVHFPIAFLSAFVVATLLALALRRPALDRFARACLFVGTVAAAATVVSGFLAEQSVARVEAALGPLEKHRIGGYVVLGLAALLSALAAIAPRHPRRVGAFRAAATVGGLGLGGALLFTAHEGSELVHDFGVGTRMTAPGGPLHEGNAASPAPSDAPAPTGRDFR